MAGLGITCIVGIQSEHAVCAKGVKVIRLYRILPAIIVAILHVLNEPLVNVVSLAPICDRIFFGDAHPVVGVAMVGITITTKSLDATLGMLFEPEIHV